MKNNNLLMVLVTVVLIVGLFLYFNAQKEKTTINVSGTSVINALADEVSVYVNIETLKDTAEESKNENAVISEKVLKALNDNGITKEERIELAKKFNIHVGHLGRVIRKENWN